MAISNQLDMLTEFLTPEEIQSEKIRVLAEKQDNLRKGIFKRWSEQEKEIESLKTSLNTLINVLNEK